MEISAAVNLAVCGPLSKALKVLRMSKKGQNTTKRWDITAIDFCSCFDNDP